MKSLILVALFLFINLNLTAKIIYLEPVQSAKYVNVKNNIIIGFNEAIENSDLSPLIKVTGSLSGTHSGKVILTADRKRILFKPDQPFAFDERVDVVLKHIKTITSNNNFSYSFQTQINKPEWNNKNSLISEIGNSNYNSLYKGFTNVTDTSNLPSLIVNVSNNPTPGNLYLSNFPFSIIPNTPYLITANNSGTITYSREVSVWGLDYKRQPNGFITYNTNGKFYEENLQHSIIDSFECGNGYATDHHELQIDNKGHAFLMSYDPQHVNMSQIVPGGDSNAIVTGLIIQELDQNKNVVFQWRSWDHFAITDAVHEDLTAANIDCVHGNAIDIDNDGNLLISSRHLSEITKINRTTGDIIWRLGGVNNQFTFTNDTIGFSYQHHIRRIPNGNVTLFDNGNFHAPHFSRAVEYQLDEVNKTATLVWQYRNTPNLWGFAMGSVQRLHNGNTLISWGATNPTIIEVTPSGNIALQMNLPTNIFTYRTYRDESVLTLNIILAPEGFYNTQSGTLNMKDTVRSYLRNAVSPYKFIDSSKSVIDSVNFNGVFRFYNISPGTYYVVVKHRNSIETWSKNGGESLAPGNSYNYDFTDSMSKAYGNNLAHKGSKYCIYSGDVNQDGFVDLSDLQETDNGSYLYLTGYLNYDVNGDNFVDISDLLITEKNSFNYVTSVRP
jgi:Arylsulfotransferase (ASST)/Bacterial Ig-like domain